MSHNYIGHKYIVLAQVLLLCDRVLRLQPESQKALMIKAITHRHYMIMKIIIIIIMMVMMMMMIIIIIIIIIIIS